MLSVIAEIEVVAGKRDDFITEFHKVVPLVLAEDGCVEYGPTVDAETDIPAQIPRRDNIVTIVEKWESLDHLKSHLVAPHMTEYRGRVKELVVGSVLRILDAA
jgi:quinol monooxygenase YgiN